MAAWDLNAGYTDSNNRQTMGGLLMGGKKQGIYEQSATANYPLGYLVEMEDGRRYRYAHFVGAAGRGACVSQDVSLTCFGPIDGKCTAAATGATSVIVTDTDTFGTVASDGPADHLFAGGYLMCEDDSGEGHIYRIRDSLAQVTAGKVTFYLYDPLVIALTTDSDVAGIGHKWKNLRVAAGRAAGAAADCIVSGVTLISVTAGYYAFVQTKGPCMCLAEVAASSLMQRGTMAFLDDAETTGAVMGLAGVASNTTFNAGDVDTPFIGHFLFTATDGAYVGVDLCIE